MEKRICLSLLCALALSACAAPKKSYVEPPPSLRLTLLPHGTVAKGETTMIDAKINDIKSLNLLTDNNLETRHTQKIHLLVIDPSLTDYQHLHPQATNVPGLYRFQFTPKLAGRYRVFADVTPVATHKQEYAAADLGPRRATAPIIISESSKADMGGYHFTLHFDKPPMAGGESMSTIHITDARGKPVDNLRPVMGAFGHIVGFYSDLRSIVHLHPLGQEPQNDKERGGPDLTFHLSPVKPGSIKLFAQVNIDGRELFVSFGVKVAEER